MRPKKTQKQKRGVRIMSQKMPDQDLTTWVDRMLERGRGELESGETNTRSVGDSVDGGSNRGSSDGNSRAECFDGEDSGRGSGAWGGL